MKTQFKILFLILFIVSCKPKEKVFISRTEDQKIIIKNDSVLLYRTGGGCISYAIDYKFNKVKDLIIIKPNSSDSLVHLKNLDIYDIKNINNQTFKVRKDSLVSSSNGIVFYKEKYHLKNKLRESNYYILDGKKYNNSQIDELHVNFNEYDVELLSPVVALKNFGINQNYRTFVLVKNR